MNSREEWNSILSGCAICCWIFAQEMPQFAHSPGGLFCKKNTLLWVIPTMTFIRFVTGNFLTHLLSYLHGENHLDTSHSLCKQAIAFFLVCDVASRSAASLPNVTWHHRMLSSGILSDMLSGVLSGISSGILSDISSGILSGIASGILPSISSGISSGKSYGILSGISSRILSDILSGISSGILSGFWGPAVRTELGRPQVEVQRCTLSLAGPRLRSSGARWARKVPGWGPAVHTELGRSQVEVAPKFEELGQELARQQWTRRRRRRRRTRRRRMRRTALIKFNNPHLAGGEQD